ncbi:MAG: 16S rRNA (cytosine(967)-C(5))-methyltransferase RsmB [Candidatus Accumulibacter sp.]|jgi:16S rRNA (cytosine967-C5)-methyltransferase|nr:16S rRNA (cytosine(967)-C(5))-methyltransferase RsmB [Accumulibacter sp.]
MKPDSLGWSLLLAARALARVDAGESLSEAMIPLTLEAQGARAAAQDIVYGVLRRFGESEFVLGRLMRQKLAHAETYALLKAALYRLETRPDARPMVVDQAVTAAGELAEGRYKKLVNGVLRNYLRQREVLISEGNDDEAVRARHPLWWVKRLKKDYPDRWESVVDAGNSAPPMALRVNLRKTSADAYADALAASGLKAKKLKARGEFGDAALLLEVPVSVDRLPGFYDGLVSVQDLGAQCAATLLAPATGKRVLDACAAPGGKTAHLLESADVDLVALDVDAVRAGRIEENLRRLGLSAEVRVADCRALKTWWDGCAFDAVLVDAPCSGSGVVRRHPDIKALRRESDIRKFAVTQGAILDALWPTLAPGGRLLYATCSVFVEENAGVVDAFLVRRPDAESIQERQLLPDPEHDGFYYALLRKTA